MVSKQQDGITQNLSSWRFDTAVEGPLRELLYLRKRSYATTISMVCHATYLVSVLNEVKRRATHVISPETKIGLIAINRLKIGFIGCGRLGTHLIKALLKYSNVCPEDITISTRRPESFLDDFKERGVISCYDNLRVVEDVDIAFLCCLPSQVEQTLEQIKGKVTCYIYSFVPGYQSSKLNQLLEYRRVFKPMYSFNSSKVTNDFSLDFNYGVCEALAVSEFREMTCPLCIDKENSLINLDEKFIEVLYYMALNTCLESNLSDEESVQLVNGVIFPKALVSFNVNTIFDARVFEGNKSCIFLVQSCDTFLSETLKDQHSFVFTAFRSHYKAVFSTFIDWRIS